MTVSPYQLAQVKLMLALHDDIVLAMLTAREPSGRSTRFCGEELRYDCRENEIPQQSAELLLPHPHHLPPLDIRLGFSELTAFM